MSDLDGHSLATDPGHLRRQYADAEKIEIRQRAHQRYSERQNADLFESVVRHLQLEPGDRVVDIGCGNGAYHALMARSGARVIALDASQGMLRVTRERALEQSLAVSLAGGQAEQLPIASASCQAVAANHMLYHVTDQLGALREMRRVLAPGGRVVLSTNAASFGRQLWELHEEAASAIGLVPERSVSSRFTLDDLAMVRRVFPNARVQQIENAFLFPDAEAALSYYASGLIDMVVGAAPSADHSARLIEAVGSRVRQIIERDGVFRVSKSAGCFYASV